jgi:hypothetical protein
MVLRRSGYFAFGSARAKSIISTVEDESRLYEYDRGGLCRVRLRSQGATTWCSGHLFNSVGE